MLVLEGERVELEGRRAAALEGFDHRLAAARVAADRVDRDRSVSLAIRPASVSGRSSATAPVAWQPGLVTLRARAIACACPAISSGKP